MKFYTALVALLVICATESLMSMDVELITKHQYLVNHQKNIQEYAAFIKKNKVLMYFGDYTGRSFINVTSLNDPSISAFGKACTEATNKGKAKVFLTSVKKKEPQQYITNVQTIIVPNESENCFLVTMKPSPF